MIVEDLTFFAFKIIVSFIFIFSMYQLASTPINQINHNAGIFFTIFYFQLACHFWHYITAHRIERRNRSVARQK